MSGNDQTFSFVNGRIGLLSPSIWKIRALCGVSVGIQVTAPGAYMADSDWPGRDEVTGGWTLPYCGLEYMLRRSDSGYSLSIDTRVILSRSPDGYDPDHGISVSIHPRPVFPMDSTNDQVSWFINTINSVFMPMNDSEKRFWIQELREL